jgi:hypothetical protein
LIYFVVICWNLLSKYGELEGGGGGGGGGIKKKKKICPIFKKKKIK